MNSTPPTGSFLDEAGERWYRIDAYDRMDPFFVVLAGDSDLWAFVSTNGSLTAGRRDPEQSFFPYETVDKIHTRWEHTGPRTWIRFSSPAGPVLWEPFARRPGAPAGQRRILKNLTGTRLAFEEVHPDGNLCFRQEWSSHAQWGLIRRASLKALKTPVSAEVLDGVLNLIPAGLSTATYHQLSNLADAYRWNETLLDGRLGLFTLYAQIWDRAEPKESFEALTVWYQGLTGARSLLSPHQVEAFCQGRPVAAETLTRGRRGAFLVAFEREVGPDDPPWFLVIDGPVSQARTADLAARLTAGAGSRAELEAAVTENDRGLRQLLCRADGFQTSADESAGTHHTANVLFNIQRGGVFPAGTSWDLEDLKAFVLQRNRSLEPALSALLEPLPSPVDRSVVLEAARAADPQLERLVREYLPLTFSRRHGDPSRPWNRFSVRVRDAAGRRVLGYQGNWRDIFQNWEALAASEPAYLDAFISTFLSAMTPDGHNPYRISRDGIDWEVLEEDNPWSFIGYWGDHQVVYLLKFLEAAEAQCPGLLADLWSRPRFAFADVPYRIRGYQAIVDQPKATIDFDRQAHDASVERERCLGGDGRLVADDQGRPVLGTLAEKLVTIVVAKAGNLVPGAGIWMTTQRPEWNDANNALVGHGVSMVTLAAFYRFLMFLRSLSFLDQAIDLPAETAEAVDAFTALALTTPPTALTDDQARRRWMDGAGAIAETWRSRLYQGWARRRLVRTEGGAFIRLIEVLQPLVEGTLRAAQRSDGLYHSYQLLTLESDKARVEPLYPMLEGQVALMSSGLLNADQVVALGRTLKASALYDRTRRSYRLYPDRTLPRFLEKNLLDAATLAQPSVQTLLSSGRWDVLEVQADGGVRFAPRMANRGDLERALDGFTGRAEVAEAYERLLGHRAFTGRSGTMFGYEGLGCIYWHMVAKLLLAVQEAVFDASDRGSPQVGALRDLYRDIRSGLGYKKSPGEYGAFPFDPYSHTPGEGGAQQPGMTGQVKEEILTRWGELGLRWKAGRLIFDPVLFDRTEIPDGGALEFTYQRVPFAYRRTSVPELKALTPQGWVVAAGRQIPWGETLRVEAGLPE